MENLEKLVHASEEFLSSDKAAVSLETNVYWPKWNSPWWHISLLKEMGMCDRIPRKVLRKLLDEFLCNSIDFFPFRESDVPSGKDPIADVPCHCQLASMYQVFFLCGFDVDVEIPWARPWFLKYQLPDGGLNCDEAVYLKATPKSSIVSTLPALEAILTCTNRPFSEAEITFLDAGAHYLLSHRLFRAAFNPENIINPDWKLICFPRFYQYDFLRGLAFICRWSEKLKRSLDRETLNESLALIKEMTSSEKGFPILGRRAWEGAKTYRYMPDGSRTKGHSADSFPLLEMVGVPGTPCPFLKNDLDAVRRIFPEY
ncbi:MAG: hypothetical protein HQM08_18290 [Candidatus Riflebacteria bacterium]|nr:hypothetical protein [Candidatus Riflebacteria bacterium]